MIVIKRVNKKLQLHRYLKSPTNPPEIVMCFVPRSFLFWCGSLNNGCHSTEQSTSLFALKSYPWQGSVLNFRAYITVFDYDVVLAQKNDFQLS